MSGLWGIRTPDPVIKSVLVNFRSRSSLTNSPSWACFRILSKSPCSTNLSFGHNHYIFDINNLDLTYEEISDFNFNRNFCHWLSLPAQLDLPKFLLQPKVGRQFKLGSKLSHLLINLRVPIYTIDWYSNSILKEILVDCEQHFICRSYIGNCCNFPIS